MVKDFQISDEAASLVVDLHLGTTEAMQRTTPQEQPILLLVGGQPGAGKSGTSKDAKSYLRAQGGYVHLDADRLREGIPEYPRFVREFGEQASVITQAASGKCVAKLRALALEGKRNILEEGTLRGGGEVFTRYANRMQEQGYRVELRILAVAPEESRLGIYTRYEDQLSAGSRGARFVPDSYHDQTCDAMVGTVQALEPVADRVSVVTRNGDVLYDSQHQGIGKYKGLRKLSHLNSELSFCNDKEKQILLSFPNRREDFSESFAVLRLGFVGLGYCKTDRGQLALDKYHLHQAA